MRQEHERHSSELQKEEVTVKTIVVLERQEIEQIVNGEPFALRLADGSSITIQAEREREREREDGVERKPRRKAQRKARAARQTHPGDEKGLNARPSVNEKLLLCPAAGCGRRFIHQAWLDRHREREHGNS